MTRFRSIAVSLGLAICAALVACGNGPPTTSASGGVSGATSFATKVTAATPAQKVNATDTLKFEPPTVSVKANDVVEWDNPGQTPHNITFDDQSVSDNSFNPSDTYQLKFTQAGTYKYKCTLHPPSMNGSVTVS